MTLDEVRNSSAAQRTAVDTTIYERHARTDAFRSRSRSVADDALASPRLHRSGEEFRDKGVVMNWDNIMTLGIGAGLGYLLVEAIYYLKRRK